ncbi:MAG: purine-nucleoside phosphorylase [Desulfovermiculus sp.]|nr:purine-nucleoside phosphorylase [Desulfovermiculus sp.]
MHLQPSQTMLTTVRSALRFRSPPTTAIVLGTGLGQWVDSLADAQSLPYTEIPGFPQSTVQSHAGRLILGQRDSRQILVFQGRFHFYEGYTASEVCTGVRLASLLGIRNIILTNAAGSINPLFQTGTIMLIADHMNMTWQNPLVGPNNDQWGPRFPDMSQVYSPELQELAGQCAQELGLRLERGVYVGVQGPSLETPAETRAYRSLGGDAIGMSTVLEAIAAKHMGLNILGLACLTNKNLPDCMQETSVDEIIARAQATGRDLGRLLDAVIPRLVE